MSSSVEKRVISKWKVLVVFWLVQATTTCFVLPLWVTWSKSIRGTSGQPWGRLDTDLLKIWREPVVWMVLGLVVPSMMFWQTLSLLPALKPRPRLQQGGALWLSATAIGFGLTVLLLAATFGVTSILRLTGIMPDRFDSSPVNRVALAMVDLVVMLSGVAWVILIGRRMRRGLQSASHADVVRREAGCLLIATLALIACMAPIDIVVRHTNEWYVSQGSYSSLMLCIATGTFAAAPVILAPMLDRGRRAWWTSRCELCGYDVSSLIADGRQLKVCPECGGEWKPRVMPVSVKAKS